MEQWGPTADYLNWMIADFNFTIVPLDFNAIYPSVKNREIDFVLTNSAFYIGLVYHHHIQRILTLKNKRLKQGTSEFGGTIFTRKDNKNINSLQDLRGKNFMAVDKNSFGGWLMAKYHLQKMGIKTEKHFRSLKFGGTHDAVVLNVLNGQADAGTVRTDTLERMAEEGKINIGDFKILDAKNDGFPFLHTTDLYSEWPLAVLPHVDEAVTKQVMIALLQLTPENEAAVAAEIVGWTNALDYYPVRHCLQNLKSPPFEKYNVISWQESVRQHWRWYIFLTAVIITILFGSGFVLTLNLRLKRTTDMLNNELTVNGQLSEHLQQFKLTLDQTRDCVFMFDPITLKYIYANLGAVEQVKYSMDELLSMTPLDLTPGLNERQYRESLIPLIKENVQSITYTTIHVAKDGTSIPVEIVQQYVRISNSESRFISIVRDITERLRENMEKEKLHSRLLHAQKLESVGQLAAGIAHEINTPTQFIGTNIDFMNETWESVGAFMSAIQKISDDAPEAIKTRIMEELESADWEYLAEEFPLAISQSQEGVDRITSIVRAMKEFSHPGSKDKEPNDLNTIIETTITVARNEWKYVADLNLNLDDDLPKVSIMKDEMGQVILNMLVNAAHAIGEKFANSQSGEKGTITISTRHKNNYVEMRIADNGSGIPDNVKSRVFDPFYTTKDVGKGTGQGLAISHDVIVGKHGGSIDFSSIPGKGTEFIITLPLGEQSDDQEKNSFRG